MIYKRILILLILAGLGACSSLPSSLGETNDKSARGDASEQDEAVPVLTDKNAGESQGSILQRMLQTLFPDDTAKNSAAKTAAQETISGTAMQNRTGEGAQSAADILLAQSLLSKTDLFKASKRTLHPSTKVRVAEVISQFKRGELAQSERDISQILSRELNLSSSVYVLAGDIALANNKPDEATEHYMQALKINGYSAKAANRLGMQMREQGKFHEAQAYYTQAITAQPGMPYSYRNRAVLFDLYMNHKAKALQDYRAYSALLNYALAVQEDNGFGNGASAAEASSAPVLSEQETKALKSNISLAKRWVADLERQVDALASVQNSKAVDEVSTQ